MNTTGRNYKREQEGESKERKAGRAARNRARLKMFKHLAKKHGEVYPEDGTFLYQFESEDENNVHDYFMSDRYVI